MISGTFDHQKRLVPGKSEDVGVHRQGGNVSILELKRSLETANDDANCTVSASSCVDNRTLGRRCLQDLSSRAKLGELINREKFSDRLTPRVEIE